MVAPNGVWSLDIGDKNTWEDWGLIPTERPSIKPPSVKEQTLEIPGGMGIIDQTENLTGYPLYGLREGEIEFYVTQPENYDEYHWDMIYQDILKHVHGRRLQTTSYCEDQMYYYEGRWTVDKWKTNKDWSRITLKYKLDPYRYSKGTAAGLNPEVFDPINVISTGAYVELYSNLAPYVEDMPVHPTITITNNASSTTYVKLINEELNLNVVQAFRPGETYTPRFTITNMSGNNIVSLLAKGHATVAIDFRNGRL